MIKRSILFAVLVIYSAFVIAQDAIPLHPVNGSDSLARAMKLRRDADSLVKVADSLRKVADLLVPRPANYTGITNFTPTADSLKYPAQYGIASWYGPPSWDGRGSASGETFRNDSLTAAHKSLPFGTVVKVTNLKNDSVIYVKITDRLPQNSTRSIDLTPRVAKALGFYTNGLTKVRIEVVGKAPIYRKPKPKPATVKK